MQLLLSGIRVIEVGAVVLGPYAGQILADLGAEVIKVEPPVGDIARHAYPKGTGGGALFVNNNRNKRMLSLDLKQPQAREALTRLIESADVLLHNMRLDAAERLGLDFATVAAANSQIVHCAATGFGRQGPYRDRPAFDDIIQAASGLAGFSARQNGNPSFAPTVIADKVTSLHAVYGILAALLGRERGQAGPFQVEVPMFEVMVAFLMNEHLAAATFAEDGAPGYPRVLSADRRPFRTADGWIAVLPYTEAQWRRFLVEIGRTDLCEMDWFSAPHSRQAHIGELYAAIAAAMPARTTEAWITLLESADVPCSHVASPEDLLTDPHLSAIDFFAVPPGFPSGISRFLPQPVTIGGAQAGADTSPGAIGADSRAILMECGYDAVAIDQLVLARAVSL